MVDGSAERLVLVFALGVVAFLVDFDAVLTVNLGASQVFSHCIAAEFIFISIN